MVDRKKGGDRGGDQGSKGVSFRKEAQTTGGMFASGPCTIVESRYVEYDYGGKSAGGAAQGWMLQLERPGEERYEAFYSAGKGWKPSKDGLALIPRNGQTGLSASSNAGILAASMEDAGIDLDVLDQIGTNAALLDMTDVEVKQVPQPVREGLAPRARPRGREQEPEQVKTMLIVIEFLSEIGKGGKIKGDGKAAGKVEAGKGKTKPVAEAEPAAKPAVARRRAAPEPEPEPEVVEFPYDEAAKEALLAALEGSGGKLKEADLEAALLKKLKGNADKEAILDRILEGDSFLELEDGWTWNGNQATLA